MGFLYSEAEQPKPVRKPKVTVETTTILGCEGCSLRKEWGVINSPRMKMYCESDDVDILVIGEGPGQEEDNQGRQFVGQTGQTGQLLRSVIPRRDHSRIAWQNACRCRPKDNRAPTPQEVKCCSIYLDEDILSIRPKAILGVGGVPLQSFFGPSSKPVQITETHALKFPVQIGDHVCWYYPVFHPSFAARISVAEPVFRADVKDFFANVDDWSVPDIVEIHPSQVTIAYDFNTVDSIISKMTPPLGVDIETASLSNKHFLVEGKAVLRPYEEGARIICASISDGAHTVAFPVEWPSAETKWGLTMLLDIIQKHEWIAHNTSMELSWFWHRLGLGNWLPRNFFDSMSVVRILNQRKHMIGLEHATRIYLGTNVKMLSKVNPEKILNYPLDEVLRYVGLDALGSWWLYHRLAPQLTRTDQTNVDRILASTRSTVAMELMGLPVDLDVSKKLCTEIGDKHKAVVAEIERLPEVRAYEAVRQTKFSVSSPIQLGEILKTIPAAKDRLKFTKKGEASGRISTDDSVLEQLKDVKLAGKVLEERELSKLNSTYILPILSGEALAPDGMLHPSYHVMLTHTGRTGSQNINIQNVPKRANREVRRQVPAPPGHVLVAFDFKQLEGWQIACNSRCSGLCKAIIEKDDMHSRWLNVAIEHHPEYLDIVRVKFHPPEERLRKTARDDIKGGFVFASLFGAQAKTCASHTGIPLPKIEAMHELFWRAYPGVHTYQRNQHQLYKDTATVQTLTGMKRHGIMKGNEVINTPVQGTSTGHLVLECQNALSLRAFETGDMYFHPRINIHDDLTFILPEQEDRLSEYIEVIGQELVAIRFNWQIVPLTVEWSFGYNWCDLVEGGVFTGEYVR